jgi:hypothetical protein
MGGGWSTPGLGALPPGKTQCPLHRRLRESQGRSGRVQKTLSPTVIRSADRPAHSESLYLLSYPGPTPWALTRHLRFRARDCDHQCQKLCLHSPFCLHSFQRNNLKMDAEDYAEMSAVTAFQNLQYYGAHMLLVSKTSHTPLYLF